MKVKCRISHEQTHENGGFKIYEAGKFYNIENPDPKYFETTEEQAKTLNEPEKKETKKYKGGYEK